MMSDDEESSRPIAAEQMIRATYTAPSLIGEGSGSPLLDQARKMVNEDFPNEQQRREKEQEPPRG